MIILDCSNCGQTLEVDDAFAGGVCRCRHCGTIQTVPADNEPTRLLNEATTPTAKGAVPLYRREEQRDEGPSGLEELADVVASSGTLSSGLYRTSRTRSRPPRGANGDSHVSPSGRGGKSPADRRLILAIALAAVLAVIAAGLAIALLTGGDADKPAPPTGPGTAEFLDLPLGRSVSFVVDRGQNSADSFQVVNELILETVEQMPPGSRFQIVYWLRPGFDANNTPPIIPSPALRDVAPASLTEARRKIDAITTGGSTVAPPALEVALASRAETIVLITGKADELDASFADEVLNLLGDRAVTIHTFGIDATTGGADEPLRRIADQTGGECRLPSTSTLEARLEFLRNR